MKGWLCVVGWPVAKEILDCRRVDTVALLQTICRRTRRGIHPDWGYVVCRRPTLRTGSRTCACPVVAPPWPALHPGWKAYARRRSDSTDLCRHWRGLLFQSILCNRHLIRFIAHKLTRTVCDLPHKANNTSTGLFFYELSEYFNGSFCFSFVSLLPFYTDVMCQTKLVIERTRYHNRLLTQTTKH